MKVKVADGYQVNHEGTVHQPGSTFTAGNAEAQVWIQAGWATEVKAAKAAPKAKAEPKAKASPKSEKPTK